MRLLFSLALPLVLAVHLAACSNGDTSASPGTLPPGVQPPLTKLEAGAPCSTKNDCAAGLDCLHPATGCQAFSVCVTAAPSTCDHPAPACSCLAETVTICDGYSRDPIDTLGPCGDGGILVPVDGGTDASVPADAGPDSAHGGGTDASDAGGD